MDSKTIKAIDKAFVKIEKEIARLKLVMADLKKHYTKPEKKSNGAN